jgi:hypothetical protein
MMGFHSDQQPKLYYPSIHQEQRIPESHAPRRIKSRVDFERLGSGLALKDYDYRWWLPPLVIARNSHEER